MALTDLSADNKNSEISDLFARTNSYKTKVNTEGGNKKPTADAKVKHKGGANDGAGKTKAKKGTKGNRSDSEFGLDEMGDKM